MPKDCVHKNHRQRIKNKFLETGYISFYEHEILETILFFSIPRINTNPHAHKLLLRFKSLEKILSASPDELMEVKGIGPSSACLICAIGEAVKRYLNSNEFDFRFSDQNEIKSFIVSKTKHFSCDTCMIISVGAQFELTGINTLPLDDLVFSKNSSRVFIENVIRSGADRIIVAICRPDKLPLPSQSDFDLTRIMAESLRSIKAELADVYICGKGSTFSLRNSGAFSFN